MADYATPEEALYAQQGALSTWAVDQLLSKLDASTLVRYGGFDGSNRTSFASAARDAMIAKMQVDRFATLADIQAQGVDAFVAQWAAQPIFVWDSQTPLLQIQTYSVWEQPSATELQTIAASQAAGSDASLPVYATATGAPLRAQPDAIVNGVSVVWDKRIPIPAQPIGEYFRLAPPLAMAVFAIEPALMLWVPNQGYVVTVDTAVRLGSAMLGVSYSIAGGTRQSFWGPSNFSGPPDGSSIEVGAPATPPAAVALYQAAAASAPLITPMGGDTYFPAAHVVSIDIYGVRKLPDFSPIDNALNFPYPVTQKYVDIGFAWHQQSIAEARLSVIQMVSFVLTCYGLGVLMQGVAAGGWNLINATKLAQSAFGTFSTMNMTTGAGIDLSTKNAIAPSQAANPTPSASGVSTNDPGANTMLLPSAPASTQVPGQASSTSSGVIENPASIPAQVQKLTLPDWIKVAAIGVGVLTLFK